MGQFSEHDIDRQNVDHGDFTSHMKFVAPNGWVVRAYFTADGWCCMCSVDDAGEDVSDELWIAPDVGLPLRAMVFDQ